MEIIILFLTIAFIALSAMGIKRLLPEKTTVKNLKAKTPVSVKPLSAIITAPSPEELDTLGFRFPELPRITCEKLKELMYNSNKPPVIIDTRHSQLFTLLCMPTAINMPASPEDEQKRMLLSLTRDRPIVFYCGCEDDGEAAKTADRILKLDADFKQENILILWKGWPRWQELGYPHVCHNSVLRDV